MLKQSRKELHMYSKIRRAWKLWEEDAVIKYVLETVPSRI
jgi:hypothetical protein